MLYFSSLLPSVRSVAVHAAGFVPSFFGVRSSQVAAGGFVAVSGFFSAQAAEAFAASVVSLLPAHRSVREIAVRSPRAVGPAAGLFRVSVPVCPASVPVSVLSGSAVFAAGFPGSVVSSVRFSPRFAPSCPGLSPVAALAFVGWLASLAPSPAPVPVSASSAVSSVRSFGAAVVGGFWLPSPAASWVFA